MIADRDEYPPQLGKLRLLSILACLALLVSCAAPNQADRAKPSSPPGASVATNQSAATQAVLTVGIPDPSSLQADATKLSPNSSPTIESRSTAVPDFTPTTRYDLDAVLDYLRHTVSVTETIHYVNRNTDSLNDLVLLIEPNRWQGGFSLVSLAWGDGVQIDQYDLNNDQMRISLPHPLEPGDTLALTIRYVLIMPEIIAPSETSRPQPYGYTERQANLVDWYAYIPPYRPGSGWLVHKHWWFGEHQVYDVAEFNVKLSLAEPVQDVLIAASAPAGMEGTAFTYHVSAARTFALSASTEYLLQSTTVGNVTIYSYSFSYDKSAGQEVLQDTAQALQLYSQLIMPYPHSTLSVVEADFLDGMEYDGLYFLSHGFYNLYDGTPKGYLTFIAAHETAHQWWYGLVGNDQALEPWLDEALCTYMEHIFYENIDAGDPAGSGQSLVDWWWYYRVDFYHPSGWIDGSIYDFDQFRPYRDAVYLNGAKFLDELRSLVGDPAFFAFLKDYAARYKYKVATAADFFEVLRQHTSKDIDGLIARYFQVAP